MILFIFVTQRKFDYRFSLSMIDVALITFLRRMFIAHQPLRYNNLYCSKLGNTNYVRFNMICYNCTPLKHL